MTRRLAALALFLVLAAPAAALVGDAPPADQAIARHVVLVLDGPRGRQSACSGIAIARDLVLSAGHCVQPASEGTVVDYELGQTPRRIKISKAVVHPQYDERLTAAGTPDLALLKLASPLSPRTVPVQLGERTVVLI